MFYTHYSLTLYVSHSLIAHSALSRRRSFNAQTGFAACANAAPNFATSPNFVVAATSRLVTL